MTRPPRELRRVGRWDSGDVSLSLCLNRIHKNSIDKINNWAFSHYNWCSYELEQLGGLALSHRCKENTAQNSVNLKMWSSWRMQTICAPVVVQANIYSLCLTNKFMETPYVIGAMTSKYRTWCGRNSESHAATFLPAGSDRLKHFLTLTPMPQVTTNSF